MNQLLLRPRSMIAAVTSLFIYQQTNTEFPIQPLLRSRTASCWVSDDELKNVKKMHTNVYVWGEGYQVDSSQEFSNFTPKKIRAFQGAEKPDIVDMAFGWYHEAYIDKQGKLYVCAKAKMSSIKIKEIQDGAREALTEVTTLPPKTKVRQVAFTRQRMFVMSEDGKVFAFVIKEKAGE